jgi:hypothetical protein
VEEGEGGEVTGLEEAARWKHQRKGPPPKKEAVEWLRMRPNTWSLEAGEIGRLLKKAGLFSASTYALDIRIGRLINAAREK